MEENTPTTFTSNPPPERTAETLRELHERTRAAIESQRARMGELETQLTAQLDAIAGQIAEQVGAQGGGQISVAVPDQQALDEIARLRVELEKTRVDWNAERNAWEADRIRLMSDDRERANSLDARQADVDSRQHLLDERGAQLNHRDRELCQRQALLDSYSTQCASQQSQLTELETKLAQEREALNNSLAELRATQALVDHQQNELAGREQALQRDEATLAADRAMLEAELESFNSERDAFKTERAEATALSSTTDELATQLANADQTLAIERDAWEKEMAAVRNDRRNLELERDELSTALAASRAELKAAKVHSGAADERDELRQKFDIALEDLQRLRNRVTELEQDLTSRPAVNESDSVELVHLRSERDTLAERVAELEKQPAATADADAAQEMADLQRRFELAVEDVRDLKKQNASLELRLVEAQSQPAVSTAGSQVNTGRSGGSSWELMKQQMLADLEGEGAEALDASRMKQRSTIENTILITDEVVANKDREIAVLKLQISEGIVAAPVDEQFVEQIDADEVIGRHRERIAQIEREMEDKLRAAEMEISVKHTKIARDQAHLADLQAELDSQRAQGAHGHGGGGGGTSQTPKRRWLSKLGLSGDEE